MKTFLTFAAVLLVAALPFASVCAQSTQAQDVAAAARAAGSVEQTTMPVQKIHGVAAAAARPLNVDDVTAVCMTTANHAGACPGASATMAYCDVEAVGLARCLATYAPALVKHEARARQTFDVTVQDTQGATRTVTVLLPITATAHDAELAALDGAQNEKVVAVN